MNHRTAWFSFCICTVIGEHARDLLQGVYRSICHSVSISRLVIKQSYKSKPIVCSNNTQKKAQKLKTEKELQGKIV